MAVPLIPLLWGAGVALASATAGAFYYRKRAKAKIREKVISILGPRESGKSTLAKFLETGDVERHTQQNLTTEERSVSSIIVERGNESFRSLDVSGSKEAYRNWKLAYEKSDFVIYLYEADVLFSGNQRAKDRLSDDFYQISHWVNETPKPVVFVLNKEDKLTDKVFKGSARLAKIKDAALRSEPVVQGRSAIGPSNFHMVVGSLSDKTKAQGLVASVFSELEND